MKSQGREELTGNYQPPARFYCLCTLCLLKLLHSYSLSGLRDWMDLLAKPSRTILLIYVILKYFLLKPQVWAC